MAANDLGQWPNVPTWWRWPGRGLADVSRCGASESVGAGVVVAQSVGVVAGVAHDGAVQASVEHGGGDGGVAEDPAAGRG
jgi:hypothetical protein